jgi:EmrB/QacA subfamily drug resistance transporter
MAFIDSTVVNVALPAIQGSFHATVTDVQWVVESYGLFLGALILVGGSLGDLFGRRLIFLTGVVIFGLASLGCGLAASIQQLLIARSIQGVGAALLVPGSLAIISSSFDEKNRGHAIGTWSGFTAITTAVGPVLGGWLVEHASWRWAFYINLPFAAAVIAISRWRVPESRSATARRIDWLGAFLGTVGMGGLVTGFIESINLGWRSPLVLGSLIAGFACMVAFVFAQAKVSSPMVPLALFESRTFSGANLLTLFLYSAIGIFFFLFPLNLIQVQGYSATAAGLVAHFGPRTPLIFGPFIAAIGFTLFALPSIGGSYWTTFFPAIVILGFGMTVTVAPLTTVVMNSIDQDRVGTASGINNAVARVAGVLAIAILGIVMVQAFSIRLNHELNHSSLNPLAIQEIRAGENRLAGLQVPAQLDAVSKADVTRMVKNAFVFGFRVVLMICAALSLASAAASWFMLSVIAGDSAARNRS